ncbi:prolyl 4-hydroxylase alpha subunit [Holotrichia oblita]|uniref:Prolyl 4-hydroxylase alpha subunit n=1 Tax=Holotrichia oblita TaxID=644536 RepID=A0ACB9SWI5_HOLOL|nr:prolyl 4-hydroxylase alpha subunit [Holotrichia oblita]
MNKNLVIILFVFLCSQSSYSELYTAVAELEGLLHTEQTVITTLGNYIYAQEQKMLLVKRYVEAYVDQYKKASKDIQTYLQNPINAYLLVKRLTTDWDVVQDLITENTAEEFIADFDNLKSSLKFPSNEDLNGAAMALTRLQDIYRLDASSLANGEINGVKYATELTAADCFELGRQSYTNADHYHTQLWMMEADKRLKREIHQTVERSEVLEYLAFSTFKLGDVGLALTLTNKILELIPTHERALRSKVYYEDEIAKINSVQRKGEDESIGTIQNNIEARLLYGPLCRGEIRLSDDILAELKCRYVDNGNPFLKIAPFKVEEAYLDPQILIFHDVMADHEIATIKALAQSRFQRATVQNLNTDTMVAIQHRIGKVAWLTNTEHKHVKDVVHRVEDMTGLTMETAEDLQVVNYGIGGYNDPHYDFARKGEKNGFKNLGIGNRIATVLFYMSDVPQGGATIFPYLDVALWPKKGLLLFVVFLCAKSSYSELYTALAELEELLHTEHALITVIKNYITAQEQNMLLLKRYVEAYTDQYKKASDDVQAYVENPINAYLLVKRLTTDWEVVQNLINNNIGEELITDFYEHTTDLKFPSYEDLNGAAVALTRLQDTYQLDTSSLANGEINGVKYATELTAADCFELGRQSYNNADHYHTYLWMMEADERLKREVNQTVERSEILEYLAFSTFMLAKNISWNRQGSLPYEALCRGEIRPSDAILAQLKCRYTDNGNPFLKIAPFKVEEVYLDPQILIFHDVMADHEIATIKELARPRFQRASVLNFFTGAMEIVQYRISKSAWLKEIEHKHIADVVQRVEDMTRLSMETAEELQVVNYGIGGHYEPHFDFAVAGDANAFKSLGAGNRIATLLFYMSDVAQGGATVFPYLDVALWPKKGAAAFWYNLHSSGEGDKRTRHAACPVLAGSKWSTLPNGLIHSCINVITIIFFLVSNKWMHEDGQQFRRPCDLERPPQNLRHNIK